MLEFQRDIFFYIMKTFNIIFLINNFDFSFTEVSNITILFYIINLIIIVFTKEGNFFWEND